MNPFANFSADFRRFIRRPLSTAERVCIERLELQRKRCGRVRAYINDPCGSLAQVLLDYFRWHQQRLSRRDAVIITPRRLHERPSALRARFVAARGYFSLFGTPAAVGQILLLGADMYCPTVPLHANYLDRIIPVVTPLTSGRDSIIIICGNAANRNSRFYELYSRWLISSNSFFQVLDVEELNPQILLLPKKSASIPISLPGTPVILHLKKPPELPERELLHRVA